LNRFLAGAHARAKPSAYAGFSVRAAHLRQDILAGIVQLHAGLSAYKTGTASVVATFCGYRPVDHHRRHHCIMTQAGHKTDEPKYEGDGAIGYCRGNLPPIRNHQGVPP
jgi:hypothetical protein